jgi:signal transduction histidine kinase
VSALPARESNVLVREGGGGAGGDGFVTPREANADLLAEITALRDRVSALTRANAELQGELAQALAQVSEALQQQTATSEIVRVIASSPTDVQPVFDTIAASASRLCGGVAAIVARFDGEMMHLVAHRNPRPGIEPVTARLYPRRPGRDTTTGRAILECSIVHIPDAGKDPDLAPNLARDVRAGSFLAVPMLRDGRPIGAISVSRLETGEFPAGQIALLQTFADQAVTAIENVRLFNETKEALERQTATSEILRVISSSPMAPQPVFDIIAVNAARLCAARDAQVLRVDGDVLRLVSAYGSPSMPPTRSISRGHAVGRAVIDRQTIRVRDMAQAIAEFPETSSPQHGVESLVAVPLLREDLAVGVIRVSRTEIQPFTEQQIALLQTFADQAVIAIENARLFTELQENNRALTEALEQQTATSEILRVISSSPTDVQPVFDTLLRNAVRLCNAVNASLYRFDGQLIYLVANHNLPPALLGPWQRRFPRPLRESVLLSEVLSSGAVRRIADVFSGEVAWPEASRDALRTMDAHSALFVPVRRQGQAIGVIALFHGDVGAFTDQHVALLETFADQAVIAIENVRLFTELQEKNLELTQAHAQVTEALEQQTATADILKVISSSPTDIQPVLDAVARSAKRLCDARDVSIALVDHDVLRVVASHGELARWWPDEGIPITRGSVTGRAVVDRQTVHVHDLAAESDEEFPEGKVYQRRGGHRTNLAVPLVREGIAIGVIAMRRREVRPFTDQQVGLLKTFADQAVIALENVRLFSELQASNRNLTTALEQRTATSEVLRTIAQTKTDLQPVFDTIVQSAARLCHAANAAVFLTDGRMVYEPANFGGFPEALAATRARFPRPVGMDSTAGIAILTRSVFHVPDTEDPAVISHLRQSGRLVGFRSVVTVPMLREGEAVGALLVARPEPGRFSDAEVQLLNTFADQAVIAIENVRLVSDLEVANRQLQAASQHKSEFLANMSHELRTPLNAIIGFSEVLTERMFGELNEKQDEYLRDIYASGQHLLSLINDILDLSKIEAGRMELDLAGFNLPTALDSALTLVRERAGRRGIALHLSLDEGLGQMRADERKVRQVVLNLLSNAIKFTPEGGRIEVRAEPRDRYVEVSVSDTGVGIAPDDQQAIFEEFRQVGTADKKVEGTGLGLALSRKFVELHGGKIWVHSEVGMGSTFTFTIPVRPEE